MKRLAVVVLVVVTVYVGVVVGMPFMLGAWMSKLAGFNENRVEVRDEFRAVMNRELPEWIRVGEYECSVGPCARASVTVDMAGKQSVELKIQGEPFIRVVRKSEAVDEEDTLFRAYLVGETEIEVDPNVFCYVKGKGTVWQESTCEQEEEATPGQELWVEFALGGIGTADMEGNVTTSRDGFGVILNIFGNTKVDEGLVRSWFPRREAYEMTLVTDSGEQIDIIRYLSVSRNNVVMHEE